MYNASLACATLSMVQFALTRQIHTDKYTQIMGVFTLLNINATHYSSSGGVKQPHLDSSRVRGAEPIGHNTGVCDWQFAGAF